MSPTPLRIASPQAPADSLRAPPHNYEAERGLLRAILLNNKAVDRVSEFLAPEHFADPTNGRIYQVCLQLNEMGHLISPVTLRSALESDDLVNAAGGINYITALHQGAVTSINAKHYGQLIYDLFLRRELIAIGEDMVNEAFEATLDDQATDQIGAAEERLFNLGQSGTAQDRSISVHDAVAEAIKDAERAYKFNGAVIGVPTGLSDLDAKLGGLHPSDLIILAGRPGMGKSGMATTIAYNAAQHCKTTDRADHKGKVVAMFSLEMSAGQNGRRILSHLSRVDSHNLRNGHLRQEDFSKLSHAGTQMTDLPLVFDDRPGLYLSQIRAKCRRLARKGRGLALVVVDYLQLIGSPGGRERAENRVQEISAITRGLKTLAKELDVPVLALSQLSRAVEQREDKRPQLADLRESGTIEQDADVVMFVYREEYYLDRVDESRRDAKWQVAMDAAQGMGEAIVAKQRHGPVGTVKLMFEAFSTFFLSLARTEPPAGSSAPTDQDSPPPGHPAAMQGTLDGLDDWANDPRGRR